MVALPATGRLKWQCRRGVLELDILFEPFLSEKYPHLSAEEQAVFVELLTCNDEELLDWFFYGGEPDSEALKRMVLLILS